MIINAVIVTAAINFAVNGLFGWLNALGAKHVAVWSIPLFQRTSVFTDAMGTFFFLPLTTCLLCTLAVRSEQRRRALPLVGSPLHPLVSRLPGHAFLRGLALGAAAFVVLTPVTALVIAIAGIGDMSQLGFALYAALLGVALGLIATPVIAVLAMTQRPTSAGTAVSKTT